MKSIEKIINVTLKELPTLELEATSLKLYMTKRESGNIFLLRGVPRNKIDICISPEKIKSNQIYELQLLKKAGKYDGNKRWRIIIRPRQCHQVDHLDSARIVSTNDDGKISLSIIIGNDVFWEETFKQLRTDIKDYNLARIVMWQWRKYFTHLKNENIEEFADNWSILNQDKLNIWTLSQANREAAKALYKLSRDSGWKKLCARERLALNAPTTWVKTEWAIWKKAQNLQIAI